MTPVTFMHSNLKTEVTVFAEMVFAIQYLDQNKTVALLASGGGMVPISGTREEAQEKIINAINNKEKVNGISGS